MKTNALSAPEKLRAAADLFEARSKVYGANYWKCAHIMQTLFPEGMVLKTEEDYVRFQFLEHIVNKLTRYATNFKDGGHDDSSFDSIVYWAMQNAADEQFKKEETDAIDAIVSNTRKGGKK